MTVMMLALKIVILIGLGFTARKLKIIPEGFDKMLSRFVLTIPLPCMIINSFRVEFSPSELAKFPILVLLALGSLAVVAVIAQLVYLKMGKTGVARSVRFALLFTNFTFFGLPVVNELYGAAGSFYYVIFTLPIRVIFYGGAPLLLGGKDQRLRGKELAKKFFCAPVVVVFIGILLYVLQITIPEPISGVMTSVGNMASPLGLILCGAVIAGADWRGALRHRCVLPVALARLILIPAVVVAAFLALGVDKSILQSTVFCYAMPVASLLPTFLLQYNPDDAEARVVGGYIVVASTLLCVATVPLWALVLDKL